MLEAEVEHARSEATNTDVGHVSTRAGMHLDVRDRDARRVALRGEVLDERQRRVALRHHDRARQHRLVTGGPDLLEHERLVHLDTHRDVHERAPRRPEGIGDRPERGVGRDTAARRDVGADELGVIERGTEEAFEDHAGCRGLGLELELDAG